MIKAKITSKIANRTESYFLNIPTSWGDLSEKQRHEVAAVLFKDKLNFNTWFREYIFEINGLQKSILFAMSVEDIANITKLFDIDFKVDSTPIFFMFQVHKIWYYLPKEHFLNGSAIEWVLANEAYEDYSKSHNYSDLLRLVAVLCREARKDGKMIKEADIRVPIHDNSDEEEERAAKLQNIQPYVALSVLRYFEGVREKVAQAGLQFDLWKNTEDNQEDKNLFGWRSTLRDIAKTQIFAGGYDAVCQRKFWEIFQILLENQHERKRLNRNDTSAI